MDKAQLQFFIQSYKHYESRFFRNLGQNSWDGFLYGEVAFCLAGLKPVVLIDFPGSLLDQYLDAVMTPWLAQWSGTHPVADGTGDWRVLKRHLKSPELAHGIAVAFFVHTTDSRLANSSIGAHLQRCEHLDVANEDDLAFILDYPGNLPRSLGDLNTMREVVYYDQESRLVLTTFAAQLDQQQRVQEHFESYRNVMTSIGIRLGLIFRCLAS